MMSKEEKILLIQCILWDIRLNFSDEDDPTGRAGMAMDLCGELVLELKDDNRWHFHTLAECCSEYIEDYDECGDGRFFREEFPYGYYDMEKLHGLPMTRNDKSEEFKKLFDKYTTMPYWYMKDCDEPI